MGLSLTGRIVSAGGLVEGRLRCEGARVERVELGAAPGGPLLLPGFVDLHVHGGGGADVMDGPDGVLRAARFHLRHGTTALCPTSVTSPPAALRAFLEGLAGLGSQPADTPRLVGAHLEGPFLAPARRGAQPDACLAPDPALALELLAAGPVAVMTLAPELPGAEALIRLLAERGVHVSLGHSAASLEQAARGFAAGARGVTHLFNAMSGLDHRRPGLAAAALEAEGAFLELILDGHHLAPAMFRLARRAARGRLVLVSDAIRAAGLGDVESELGGQPVCVRGGRATLGDGTLAGSVLTLDQAFRAALDQGLDPAAASALLSRHPADALRRSDLGRLEPGAWADVLELDPDDLSIRRVILGGREVEPA